MKLVKKGKRLQSMPEGASMTDQSDKNLVDINVIMQSYQKTGLLPQFKEKIAQYIDTTQIPSYMEAQEQMSHAKNLFMQLPSQVRKLMDNNPANMEQAILNPEYKDLMEKYGILEKKAPLFDEVEKPAKPAAKAKSDDKKE